MRDGGTVRNLACCVAIGVNLEGERDVLGLWFQRAEDAKFWLAVLNELKQRGVRDVLICCVDGLKGSPEAFEAVFPPAWVQTCIAHLIRQSLRFVPDKHRRKVAHDLRPIYTAVDTDAAAEALASTPRRAGNRPTTGAQHCFHSKSISKTDCPNTKKVGHAGLAGGV